MPLVLYALTIYPHKWSYMQLNVVYDYGHTYSGT